MSMARPYIGKIWNATWTDQRTGERFPGISLGGGGGLAAHLTKAEAYALANDIVDAADKLPEPAPRKAPVPCYTTRSTPLTAADGTPEPDLPANIAD
ncbi:MAG: hypothetical protein ACTIJ0_10205 [Glutamicibacter ardleyensis]